MVCHPLNHKQLTGDPVSCFFCKPQWSKFLLTLRTYWCSSSASALLVSPSEIVSLLPPFSFIIGKTLSRQRQQITERDLLSPLQNHDLPISITLFCGPPRWHRSSNLRPLFFPVWLKPGHRHRWMLIQQSGQLHGAACPSSAGHLYPASFLQRGQPPRLLKDRIVPTQGCKGENSPPGHGGASEVELAET